MTWILNAISAWFSARSSRVQVVVDGFERLAGAIQKDNAVLREEQGRLMARLEAAEQHIMRLQTEVAACQHERTILTAALRKLSQSTPSVQVEMQQLLEIDQQWPVKEEDV